MNFFAKFLPTLGYDLKIACAKFQGNWFIIEGEIDEKHALQNSQNECGPGQGYSRFNPCGLRRLYSSLAP